MKSLYDGRITILFDPEEHCYLAKKVGESPIPAAGVTSIIKETTGTSPILAQWMVKQAHDYIIDEVAHYIQLDFAGTEYVSVPRDRFEEICKKSKMAHRRTSMDAADIGTEVHKFAELTLKGQEPEMPKGVAAHNGAKAFKLWKSSNRLEAIDLERIVFSEEWWYAGTCDFFGQVNGKLSVLDLKTSSGLYRDMPLQLAAYATALEEETGETINDGWIIRLCKKTGKCEPYHIELTKRLKGDWELVRATHRALKRTEELVEELKKCLT